MNDLLVENLAELISRQKNDLIIIGILICLLLIVIIYFTFFRKRRAQGLDLMVEEQYLGKNHSQPTKEEILNALVEFDTYPSFIRIVTEILNQFTMDYLYSYRELAQAFKRLVDFPKSGQGLSSMQRAAMITIVRICMTSEFIREKCTRVLDENFEKFMDETSKVPATQAKKN